MKLARIHRAFRNMIPYMCFSYFSSLNILFLQASGIKPKNLYWIGLSDENSDGIYMWVDNSPVTYTNWYHGNLNFK